MRFAQVQDGRVIAMFGTDPTRGGSNGFSEQGILFVDVTHQPDVDVGWSAQRQPGDWSFSAPSPVPTATDSTASSSASSTAAQSNGAPSA